MNHQPFSTSPAQTGEPTHAQLAAGAFIPQVSGFATRQTGGVDQAWVDKAMRSLEAAPVKEASRKAEAISSAAFTTGQYSHEAIRQLIRAIRDARTHLSTALGAQGKS